MRRRYDSFEIERLPHYRQVYEVIEKDSVLSRIRDAAIRRCWDTFIADALIGNFDRHKGNWGYVINRDTEAVSPAPVYGCGSTLYPALSEKGMAQVLRDPIAIQERLMLFPKAALLVNRQKISYYDMLASGYDRNCTDALLRICPRIDLDAIFEIIDNTPLLSDIRKTFYRTMIKARKERILDAAFEMARDDRHDESALERVRQGIPYTKDLFTEEFGVPSEESPDTQEVLEIQGMPLFGNKGTFVTARQPRTT